MPSGIKIYGDTILFGVRIAFESNHRSALCSALSLFPQCDSAEPRRSDASVYIVLDANGVNETRADSARTTGPWLDIVRDGVALTADGEHGRGVCTFPEGAVNGDAFREAVDTIVLFLVAHAGRIPFHASAIMLGDRAIVMAGRSGAGKSSLAMAASRAGLPVLSEDTVFIQTEPSFCVWARTKAIHLLEKDAPDDLQWGLRVRGGRIKRAFPVAVPRHKAEEAILCILSRGDEVGLQPVREDEAVSALVAAPEPGYEFYGARSVTAARALAAGGCWRLTLSRDPGAAIAALLAAFPATANGLPR